MEEYLYKSPLRFYLINIPFFDMAFKISFKIFGHFCDWLGNIEQPTKV